MYVVQILGTYIFKFFINIIKILKSTMTQQKDPRRTKAGAKKLFIFEPCTKKPTPSLATSFPYRLHSARKQNIK
jgi:hypothetical protein